MANRRKLITERGAVILAIVKDHGAIYGGDILAEYETRTGAPIKEPTMYQSLDVLRKRGYLTGRLEKESTVQGQRRTYNSITKEGIKALEDYRAHARRILIALRPKPSR